MRNIFYDTEFIPTDKGPELISIGMVDDENNKYYAVSGGLFFDRILKNKWLRENVLPYLPAGDLDWDWDDEDVKHRWRIAAEIEEFIGQEPVRLWAYYGAYDHVALCSLWGGNFNNMPKNIPWITYDLKTTAELIGYIPALFPPESDNEHHALHDALWNKELFYALRAAPRAVGLVI